ncbi:MAG: B12-binding domain-containing radical SAM protein [Candidatus Omnitrophica bacterium]|nr:B12-binding domain-containing radical SAM protein [Candidatus Omnitrophota bacterium]
MNNKVVLFHGKPSVFDKRTKAAPLALLCVSSFLVKNGFAVKIITDSLCDNYIDEAVKECKDSICLGITAMTGNQITEGLKLSSLIKARYPDLPVIWGGWHASIMPESTLRDPNVDIIVVGQGERKFYEVVKTLLDSNRNNLRKIPGVSFKENGQLIMNNEFAIEDMGNFPPVPYDIIDLEKCFSKTEYGDRTISYISSYGCPYRCSFCIEPIVNKRKWVSLPAQRVIDEWGYLYKRYAIDSIAVYDNNFFVNKQRVVDICEGLIKRNIKIRWGNVNGRIPQLVKYEKEIWALMERAGLSMVLTGSESGEQEVLDLIHKDAKVEDIYEFTKLCNKYHIKILFSYMLGIPWSDNAEFNAKKVDYELNSLLGQVNELLKISKKNRFMVYAYTPFPGSEMFEMAKKHGFEEPKMLREWGDMIYSPEDIFQTASYKRGWLTKKQFYLITMLEQYIFGMMDLDARDWIAKNFNNRLFRLFFKAVFTIGYFLARIRLRLKLFGFPMDYWVFVKFRKLIRM